MIVEGMSAFNNFYAKVVDARVANPDWRDGQTFFNVLRDEHPDLAEAVRGTRMDPFYRDDKLLPFLDFVQQKLGDT